MTSEIRKARRWIKSAGRAQLLKKQLEEVFG
jgi:hypothetical protein